MTELEPWPDWGEHPWHFPGVLWRLPYWPVRLYLHFGDKVLFGLWYHSRPLAWWLEDKAAGVGR